MKYIFTCLTLLSSLGFYAQSVQMPFNPDYDGDNVVATTDFLAVLPLFGTSMVDTSLTCDYQGTELETLLGGLMAGNLVLDSVYLEYFLIDSVITYSPECPDPFVVETVLDRSIMFTNLGAYLQEATPYIEAQLNYLGYYREFKIRYNSDIGGFAGQLYDSEVAAFFPYTEWSEWNGIAPACCNGWTSLPFPESWTLDDDGFQVDWYTGSWVPNCENFRLIPFWHEAE